MKAILLSLILLFSLSVFSQVCIITKPITYSDTTINKSFISYSWQYNSDKKISVFMNVYISKGSLRTGNNSITVPEIPSELSIDMTADQTKALSQIDNIVRNTIKSELKRINSTWTNSDINFTDSK